MDPVTYKQMFCQAVKMIDGPDGFFVHGVMVAEEPDLVNEIWDYVSSKANILTWSERMASKTHGQSVGNLRTMHGDNTTAAGRFISVTPDDAQKLFYAVAEVVDPVDQEKCRKGVYSGFSIRAPYAKKWRDGRNVRWTSGIPIETSLVDVPCIPSACFSIKMADGTEQIRRFQNHIEEEETGMTIDELNKKFDDGFAAITAKLDAFATKMAAVAAKCMKSASDCSDPNCSDHAAAKADAATKSAGKVVAIDYINTAVESAVKGVNIGKIVEDAIKAQFAPLETTVESLVSVVAHMAGTPAPTAVKVNGTAVDKKDDVDIKVDAVKSVSEVAKTNPVEGVKMIHAAGPALIMTNRGLQPTS